MSITKHNLVIAPTEEPITLAEVKTYLGIDDTESDSLITSLITSARMKVEYYLNKALVSQSWKVVFDAFPDEIELLKTPVQSVTHIKYYDTGDSQQTLDSAYYYLDNYGESSSHFVLPSPGLVWPATYDRINAVEVQYVAGIGTADDVQEDIKQTLLQLVRLQLQLANPVEGFSAPTKAMDWILKDNLAYRRAYRL